MTCLLFSLKTTDRSTEFTKVSCKLCNSILNIEWQRISGIVNHERTEKHRNLLKLIKVYPEEPFYRIRICNERNKILEILMHANQPIDLFSLLTQADESVVLHCKPCDEVVPKDKIPNHLQMLRHTRNMPKEDGYSDNEFFKDLIKLCVGCKY